MATGVVGAIGAHVQKIVALVTKPEQGLATVHLQLIVVKLVLGMAQVIRKPKGATRKVAQVC